MRPFTWLMAFGLVSPTVRIFNFDTAPLGRVPPGWTVAMTNRGAAPQWEVLRDLSAPTQPYVLAQLSTDPTGNRFPLAILDSVQFHDGDVSVRVKPVAGRQDEAGGVVFRYIDANNYYLAAPMPSRKTSPCSRWRTANGRRLPSPGTTCP